MVKLSKRLLLLFLLMPVSLLAQSLVRGKVISAENNIPLEGVHIQNLHTGEGGLSFPDGSFLLQAKPGDTLNFSSVGFLPYQHLVGEQDVLQIYMLPEIRVLPEAQVYARRYELLRKKDRKTHRIPGVRSIEKTTRFRSMTMEWKKGKEDIPTFSVGFTVYGPFSHYSKTEKQLRKMQETTLSEKQEQDYLYTIHKHDTRQFFKKHHQLNDQQYDSLLLKFNRERLPLIQNEDKDSVLGLLMLFFAENCP
ncbi:MAG: hypothetical protein ACLFQ0_04040 [Cyclobacteriaceae bacterium]